jgi:acyl carrier protein
MAAVDYVIIALAAISIASILFVLHRRDEYVEHLRLAAIRKLESSKPVNDEAFLKQLDVAPDSYTARVAIVVRNVLAEMLELPNHAIKASHRVPSDFECLIDSLDWIGMLFRMEDSAGISIKTPLGDLEKDFTVKELVNAILQNSRPK